MSNASATTMRPQSEIEAARDQIVAYAKLLESRGGIGDRDAGAAGLLLVALEWVLCCGNVSEAAMVKCLREIQQELGSEESA